MLTYPTSTTNLILKSEENHIVLSFSSGEEGILTLDYVFSTDLKLETDNLIDK